MNFIVILGPAEDCMSTSFNQESPTDETKEVSTEKKIKENGSSVADMLKEWDSDSDSQSSNSSSGEFIWKVTFIDMMYL